jgi:hypothetical protein
MFFVLLVTASSENIAFGVREGAKALLLDAGASPIQARSITTPSFCKHCDEGVTQHDGSLPMQQLRRSQRSKPLTIPACPFITPNASTWKLRDSIPRACCPPSRPVEYALITVADNGYVLPLAVMLHSFWQHNHHWFGSNHVILPFSVQRPNSSPAVELSAANRKWLQQTFAGKLSIIFRPVLDSSY